MTSLAPLYDARFHRDRKAVERAEYLAFLVEAMRGNATLLEMMANGETRLERAALHGLVADLREWARRLERA